MQRIYDANDANNVDDNVGKIMQWGNWQKALKACKETL